MWAEVAGTWLEETSQWSECVCVCVFPALVAYYGDIRDSHVGSGIFDQKGMVIFFL